MRYHPAMRVGVTRVGVVSDTHGLLRPGALAALHGCDLIVHAGDIGSFDVLDALRAVAPLVAVRGNNDRDAWARDLAECETFSAGGARLHVLHDLSDLRLDPAAEGVDVVIAGHSHRPAVERRDGVLFVNPGSAGPRRFSLPIGLALLSIEDGEVYVRLIELEG